MLVLTLCFALPVLAEEPAPLSHEEIKSTVDSHLGDVKACMQAHGVATGKLVVQFAIQPDGKVSDPKPKESSSNGVLDRCIAGKFAKWTFPKPRGGLVMGVVYPFIFSVPPPKAEAKLDQQVIVKTVQAKMAEVKKCYEDASLEKEGLEGTLRVAIVIASSGAVKEATVKDSSTKSAFLDGCVVGRVKTWLFPKPEGPGEVAIIYPFAFAPKK